MAKQTFFNGNAPRLEMEQGPRLEGLQPWIKERVLWTFEQGMKIFAEVSMQVAQYCDRYLLCGSLRRHAPGVHDLDLLATSRDMLRLIEACRGLDDSGKLVTGARKISFGVAVCRGQEEDPEIFPVEIYLCCADNWYAQAIYRTGSKENNLMLHRKADSQGLTIDWDNGVLRSKQTGEMWKKIISEASLWKYLGLEYQEPKERG